jgi:hypothetical protein
MYAPPAAYNMYLLQIINSTCILSIALSSNIMYSNNTVYIMYIANYIYVANALPSA